MIDAQIFQDIMSLCNATRIAETLGAPVEGIRLILTLLAGYPIAIFYRAALSNSSNETIKSLYFFSLGICLCYCNYGMATYHTLLASLGSYVIVYTLRKNLPIMLTVNFIYQIGYLSFGYYYTASDGYDILWTMPTCIITLRMIGYGFDISDGTKPFDKLSKEQTKTALQEIPSLLQFMAYVYFPSSFLVGPQYPFSRYKNFIENHYNQYSGYKIASMKRLCIGIIYLGFSQIGIKYYPNNFLLSSEFKDGTLLQRILNLGIWAKLTLYKYISCWIITEGALIYTGITFKEVKNNGEIDWSACANVNPKHLEMGLSMSDYVKSFNVNTNQWVAQYIYKRLRFLNNRNISYSAALAFLAVWHGFHSGYYVTFLLEYVVVTTEKQINHVYENTVLKKYGHKLERSKIYACLYFAVLKSYNFLYMGWCFVPFGFLKYERYTEIMASVNYYGFVHLIAWAPIYQVYRLYSRSKPRNQAPNNTDTQQRAVNSEKKDN